jgi:hypothetical protein
MIYSKEEKVMLAERGVQEAEKILADAQKKAQETRATYEPQSLTEVGLAATLGCLVAEVWYLREHMVRKEPVKKPLEKDPDKLAWFEAEYDLFSRLPCVPGTVPLYEFVEWVRKRHGE